MTSPIEKTRFVFVTGKGGVGKTTVTAALALGYAARGKRVLCCACNAKERFSTLFGTAPIGADIAPVAPGIFAVNLEPSRALEEYGLMILKSRTLYKTVFDNRYVRTFFRAVPGLYEWAMLGKAWFHAIEPAADGTPPFDVVLVDAPATGHGLDMLRVPKVIVDVVPPGILRRDAERAWTMFRDPSQTAVVLVTLAEDMPVNETILLSGALTGELGLPVAQIVVNGMLPPLFDPAERASLVAAGEQGSEPGAHAIAAGARRAAREIVQADALRRLGHELPAPKVFLPYVFESKLGPKTLQDFARRLS